MKPLFTIGHSTHELPAFLKLLTLHRIEAVADVRSSPYSRHCPWFSREPLTRFLQDNRIRYVFLGRELGARREERECYVEHRADYSAIATTAAFQKGLERLQRGVELFRIALLCAEKDPLECHRTILVTRHAAKFADIRHILGNGNIETGEEAEQRLLTKYKLSSKELFRSRAELLTDAYNRRGTEIAWVETADADVHHEH